MERLASTDSLGCLDRATASALHDRLARWHDLDDAEVDAALQALGALVDRPADGISVATQPSAETDDAMWAVVLDRATGDVLRAVDVTPDGAVIPDDDDACRDD